MSRQFLIPGSPFGGYVNEVLAGEYLIPNVVYLSDTTTAAAAALEGTAAAVTTASGTLLTAIMFTGAITSLTTASGTLTTVIKLIGSATCVCTAGAGAGAAGGTSGGTLTIGSTGNTDSQSIFPPPPPITHLGMNDPAWRDWLFKVNNRIQKEGQISWTQLSFLNSDLTDLASRLHSDLQQIQGGATGDQFHLTEEQHDKVDVDEILLWLSF